jgi:hypothetical protein
LSNRIFTTPPAACLQTGRGLAVIAQAVVIEAAGHAAVLAFGEQPCGGHVELPGGNQCDY